MYTDSRTVRRQELDISRMLELQQKNVQSGCEVKWVVAIYKYDDYILLPWKLEMENKKWL